MKVITWSLLAAYDVRNVKTEREVERRMLSKHTLFLSPTGPVNFIQWWKPSPTMGGNGLTLQLILREKSYDDVKPQTVSVSEISLLSPRC